MNLQTLEQLTSLIEKLPIDQQAEEYKKLVNSFIEEMKTRSQKNSENGKKWGRPKTKKEEKSESQTMEIVEKKEYWDENVNKCLNMIQSISWTIDWTKKEQRQYASLLIKKLEEIETVKSWEYRWNDILSMILLAVKDDKFYCWKITSPKKIYYDLWTLMQRARTVIKNQQDSNVVLQVV